MSKIGKGFGFCLEPPEVDTGVIGIRHFPQLEEVVEEVLSSEQGTTAGYTVPPQQTPRLHERPGSLTAIQCSRVRHVLPYGAGRVGRERHTMHSSIVPLPQGSRADYRRLRELGDNYIRAAGRKRGPASTRQVPCKSKISFAPWTASGHERKSFRV